jgi:hypothetical protein
VYEMFRRIYIDEGMMWVIGSEMWNIRSCRVFGGCCRKMGMHDWRVLACLQEVSEFIPDSDTPSDHVLLKVSIGCVH